jgi:alkylation response protein AidB-like acyl-CoA dehydrogenase
MDFTLSPPEQAIADLAERVAREVLAPAAKATDAGAFPFANLKALGEVGLLGVKIPRDHGGLGSTNLAYCHAIRALAGACASTAVTVAVTNMVADMIEKFGSEDQKARHLRNLCTGAYTAGSFALSEPGAGSDAASLRCRAERVEGGYRLNGSKMWITSGDVAGVILVMAKTDASLGARGISAFLVQPDMAGFSVGRHEEKLGLSGSSTVSLAFQDVFVPEQDRLGPEGIGFSVAMTALDGGRCGIGAQALGMGYVVLREVSVHVAGRKTSDRALGLDQSTQFRIADMALRLDAAWLLVERAASLRDHGKKMTREAAMAKVNATEAANFACQQALGLVGAAALDRTHPVARALRDVRVSRIYEGTSEVQRLVIARSFVS